MNAYSLSKKDLLDKTVILWVLTLFSLSSNFLKFDLGFISISPAVIIPVLGLLVFEPVRRNFLNSHQIDRDFRYIATFTALFSMLMVAQTIFSHWPDRALSALTKTLLFFFMTHASFSMLLASRISITHIRLLLWSSAIFVLYLAYVYLVQFGEFYIGNDLTAPTQAGRNTLALYLFLMVVMSTSQLYDNQSGRNKSMDYVVLFIFILIGFLTGSRFAVVFPSLFFVLIAIKGMYEVRFKLKLLLRFVYVALLLLAFGWSIGLAFDSSLEAYASVLMRLSNFGESGGDTSRLDLIDIGLSCFTDHNMVFGNGVKNYLTCVVASPIGTDLILHNDHLSILNNVGIVGYLLWIASILWYSKIFSVARGNYLFRLGVLTYILSLVVIDGYNSPIFAILLALARLEWYSGDRRWASKS